MSAVVFIGVLIVDIYTDAVCMVGEYIAVIYIVLC